MSLKIALISSCEISGGASIAAHRLWCGLKRNEDVSVHRFVEHREIENSEATAFSERGRGRRMLHDVMSWGGWSDSEKWNVINQKKNMQNLIRHVGWTKPDVINLHGFNQWTKPGLPRDVACKLAEIAPVVWTLHDLWPLTGTSDYAEDVANEDTLIQRGAKSNEGVRLQNLGRRLSWVGPSRWMTSCAQKGYGQKNICETIPYGLDISVFSPMDRASARAVWNLPDDRQLVVALAHNLNAERKGIQILINAMSGLPGNPYLVLAGDGNDSLRRFDDMTLVSVGSVNDERLLRTLLAAADLVAVPSLVDNLPNVMLEAMSCGIPVAGSNVGGIPDAVRPGQTGWLAQAGDVESWHSALKTALSERIKDPMRWSKPCRSIVEAEYALNVQASRYIDLFKKTAAVN